MGLVVESRLRGSIRSLSLTEGKFRVKGRRADGGWWGYFWTRMRRKSIKPGLFRCPETFQPDWRFFRLAEWL